MAKAKESMVTDQRKLPPKCQQQGTLTTGGNNLQKHCQQTTRKAQDLKTLGTTQDNMRHGIKRRVWSNISKQSTCRSRLFSHPRQLHDALYLLPNKNINIYIQRKPLKTLRLQHRLNLQYVEMFGTLTIKPRAQEGCRVEM